MSMSHLVGKMAESRVKKKTIVFLHPDLGIGGAERLVVDAAVCLQNRGHKIVIFTSHCDPRHCFDEARDGTLDVRVRGNTIIPPSFLSRFSILCAILRQLHLLVQIYSSGELANLKPNAFFVDQLSAGLPLLQYIYRRAPILFYCHFPDLHLVQGREKWLKKIYRLPFDQWEQWSMGFADAIAVNSNFTRGVVSRTWPRLARRMELTVVHPCIDTRPQQESDEKFGGVDWKNEKIILSINRFERKKDIALAIKAFAGLSKHQRKGVKLIVAGGYDNRVSENVSYHNELVALADFLELSHATLSSIVPALGVPQDTEVIFLLSVPGPLKDRLLKSAKLLVYTPSNEHFGIVPLEAMLSGIPVLAVNNGGPIETVVEGVTGWLRDPEQVDEWTKVMYQVLNHMSKDELAAMGRAGVARVRGHFADTQMAQRLDEIFTRIENPTRGSIWGGLLAFFASALVVSMGAAVLGIFVAQYFAKGAKA